MEQRVLTLEVRGGARLVVPDSLEQITPYVLLEQEDWFEDEIRFLRRWLRPGMRALDVGASFGVYTSAIARALGPEGLVWAFEPTPDTAALLERSLALNALGNTSVTKAAVTDHVGKVRFALNPSSEVNAISARGAPGAAQVEVECTTLDQAAATHGWRDLDFIKLDVEGAELEAVGGARSLLQKETPLVMFEIKAGAQVDLRVLDPLAAAGYGFYRLLPGMLALRPFDRAQPVEPFQLNLFACKPDRAAALASAGLLAVEREPSRAQTPPADDAASYHAGLRAFEEARHEPDAGARLRLLQDASLLVAASLQAARSLGRMISYARIAYELGARAIAVQCLQDAAQRLARPGAEAPAEPFLAPAEAFDRRGSESAVGEWLKCAVIEQFERLRAFSSFWSGRSALEVLAPIAGSPLRSAEAERRCQLVRMRAGLQRGPQPAPLLSARSDASLNASFWRGEDAPR